MRLAIVALVLACKADAPEPDRRVASASGSAPAAPTTAEHPIVEGAKQLPAATPKDGSQNQIWCIDQPDAIERIKAALHRDGWTDVRSRGQPPRQGVMARKGEVRFSAVASTQSDRCAGTYVVATLMKIGAVEIPPLQDGERIR